MPGVFKEMDPDLIRKVIEGYHDELTPEARKQDAFYRQFSCPNCKCPLVKDFNHPGRWSDDSLLPKALLRCELCDYTIEPETRVIVATGNPAKVPSELSIKP